MLSLRFFPALAGALLITVAVFLFMQSLIQAGQREDVALIVHSNVEVFRQEREEKEPEQQVDAPQQPTEEPMMDALDVAPPTPAPATELEIPALELAPGDISIEALGKNWSMPLGAGTVTLAGGGVDAPGFVEVIPYDTRRPNVPELAWHNRIDGWVLVAFTVTPRGRTRDVRVLDANPRGVFEEKVISAVKDWQYRLSFSGESAGTVILTQKVEVLWKNYPQNLPNVD